MVNKKINEKDQGFTLIEITIALVILSATLVTILGLHSSIVSRIIRDRNMQRATLAAKRILAAIEKSPNAPEPKEMTAPVSEVIELFGMEQLTQSEKRELDEAQGLMAHLKIDDWSLPGIANDVMRKIIVEVYEAGTPNDQLSVIYFVPNL